MTEETSSVLRKEDDEGLSVVGLVRIVIASRRLIVRMAILGGAVAVIPFLMQELEYTASASFTPKGANGTSGVSSLVGQFGLNVGGTDAAQSPEFYSDLLRARALLHPILADSVSIADDGDVRVVRVADIFDIDEADTAVARLEAYEALSRAISISLAPRSGILTFGVTTRWPSASQQIADSLIGGVNRFNLVTRQSQARSERTFFEGRLAEANDSMRLAEGRLQTFLSGNVQFSPASEPGLQFQRLQRQVAHYQGVVTALATSFEEARAREVRDTPVITVVEAPVLPARPNPRGRTRKGMLGILFGVVFGGLIGVVREGLARRRRLGDPDVAALDQSVRGLRAWLPGG